MFKHIINYFSPISQTAKVILESFEEEGRWVVGRKHIAFLGTILQCPCWEIFGYTDKYITISCRKQLYDG